MRNIWKPALIAGILAAVFATAIAAQEQRPAPTPQAPMMGQGQGMMPMMGMMQQMSQMMETCNKMMQTAMAQPTPGASPAKP